ncbi:MAG: exo-alpha-sialidase [Chthonomonadales bacterium]|nr:exo-alpha-sialidase [Chthonomonadales bacterium]
MSIPLAIGIVAAATVHVASEMKLVSKEVFLRPDPPLPRSRGEVRVGAEGRPVATGFITYIDARKPILMHCYGRVQYSDGYDDYAVSISADNGRTWSEPEVRWKSVSTPDGPIRYGEPAAFFDARRGKLIVLTDRALYPKNRLNLDRENTLVLDIYDTKTRTWSQRRDLVFPGQRSPAVSFSFPLKTRDGRIVFPGMRKTLGRDGKPLHYRGLPHTVDEVVSIIGQYRQNGEIAWHLGNPLRIAPELSSRGLNENALTELPDGRIAAVCRGANNGLEGKPGYKWQAFSADGGENWSASSGTTAGMTAAIPSMPCPVTSRTWSTSSAISART